uniref:photosystem I assembly protein ycf4 n=1 Tax=Meringosphaera mediterranea TaxID=2837474 RepID=UPI00286C3EAC|nr:photosystem I assembly protein ycf4 [Meringosphaera mediterranea]WLD05764.1 photosystem I assembly protein ycf4 [Meringosphaera mediterranea]WLD05826.1 photosystem I assembly protein ycf4 [Meringosphaera mediterranea]WLD06046.1 photosystem I assembly protein ycf4 [Meringosphaera mediterranea]
MNINQQTRQELINTLPIGTYEETKAGVIIKKEGIITDYITYITGAKRLSNYFWIVLLTIGGLGFFLAGISSYFKTQLIPFEDISNLDFLPQGILLLFYGTCGLLFSFYIFCLTNWDIGGGTNYIDIKNEKVEINRNGYPKLLGNAGFLTAISLTYAFNDISNLAIVINDGINPSRVLYLCLKDGRQIPLTPTNEVTNLDELESSAILLSQILNVELKSNRTNNY